VAKLIVTFAEGEGEELAVPALIKRLLSESTYGPDVWSHVQPDERAWRVGNLGALQKNNFEKWKRMILSARTRYNARLGGICLLLDGDSIAPGWCPVNAAIELASHAKAAGAGTVFSVAVIFARLEYESWFIAGAKSLAGRTVTGGLPGLRANYKAPLAHPEAGPRDAKGWLRANMATPYKETFHQLAFTKMVDLALIRSEISSFRRLEHALEQLVNAVRTGNHTATPFIA